MSQRNCLADGRDCLIYFATLYLSYSAVETRSCLLGKSCEAVHSSVECCVNKVRIQPQRLDICTPISPMCLPVLGSHLQSSSMKCCAHSIEVTSATTLQLRWKTVHKLWLGRGNVRLKSVSKSTSESHCHAGVLRNNRDKISKIVLCLPLM